MHRIVERPSPVVGVTRYGTRFLPPADSPLFYAKHATSGWLVCDVPEVDGTEDCERALAELHGEAPEPPEEVLCFPFITVALLSPELRAAMYELNTVLPFLAAQVAPSANGVSVSLAAPVPLAWRSGPRREQLDALLARCVRFARAYLRPSSE